MLAIAIWGVSRDERYLLIGDGEKGNRKSIKVVKSLEAHSGWTLCCEC